MRDWALAGGVLAVLNGVVIAFADAKAGIAIVGLGLMCLLYFVRSGRNRKE